MSVWSVMRTPVRRERSNGLVCGDCGAACLAECPPEFPGLLFVYCTRARHFDVLVELGEDHGQPLAYPRQGCTPATS